jgi:autonomous glycyl radical cofactor GrcA
MGKMSYTVILGILLCIVVAASGCTTQTGTGNQTPDVSGVTNVVLNGPGTLIIQQGDNESYRVEADDDLMSKISTTVSGNTLSISNLNSVGNGAVKIYITLKDLNTITANGGGNSEVTGLDTDKLTVTLDNGKMTLTGKANDLVATINGGGNIDANDLPVQSAPVTINGDGKASVNVVSTLSAVVNGGGSITYTGSPQVTQQVNGQGSIKQG